MFSELLGFHFFNITAFLYKERGINAIYIVYRHLKSQDFA